MGRKSFASMVFVLMTLILVNLAGAGVEPSPFRSQINKLGAIVNELESINKRLQDLLASPTKKGGSSPEGIVGKLEAMTNQLKVIDSRVEDILSVLPQDSSSLPPEMEGVLHGTGRARMSIPSGGPRCIKHP